jgi:hypothetical protein
VKLAKSFEFFFPRAESLGDFRYGVGFGWEKA